MTYVGWELAYQCIKCCELLVLIRLVHLNFFFLNWLVYRTLWRWTWSSDDLSLKTSSESWKEQCGSDSTLTWNNEKCFSLSLSCLISSLLMLSGPGNWFTWIRRIHVWNLLVSKLCCRNLTRPRGMGQSYIARDLIPIPSIMHLKTNMPCINQKRKNVSCVKTKKK